MTRREDPRDTLNGRRLQLVPPRDARTAAREEASDAGPVPDEPESPDTAPSHDAQSVIGNAVMHAAMSWVACCIERAAEQVNVASLGGGLFDAEVQLVGGGSCFLRVTLVLETGPRLRTQVEPVHP